MKYMLLVYSPEQAWTEEEWVACTEKSTAICQELHAKQQFRGASPLHPVTTAKTIRLKNGQKVITAGPFAETTEQLGGYFIIDVPDLDEAIAVAARLPAANKGTVEIRPLFDLPQLPAGKPDVTNDGELKFMFLCYDDETYWQKAGKESQLAAMNVAVELTKKLAARGQFLSASPLHESSLATSVRVRNGKRLITDGPFAETAEVLGGYYIISAPSIDDAVEFAAEHPGLVSGSVEVRQVYELPRVPRPEQHEIVSSRILEFPRAAVFAAFANPEQLARWWGPNGFRNTFEEFEFRPGGDWKFVMHGPNGIDYPNHSVFRAIEEPAQIELDHVCDPKFRLTITLDELTPERTRIVWRMQFESAHLRDQIASYAVDANEQNFDRLIRELQAVSTR